MKMRPRNELEVRPPTGSAVVLKKEVLGRRQTGAEAVQTAVCPTASEDTFEGRSAIMSEAPVTFVPSRIRSFETSEESGVDREKAGHRLACMVKEA